MKRLINRGLSAFLAMVMLLTVFTSAPITVSADDGVPEFRFGMSDGYIKLMKYNGSAGNVTVPDRLPDDYGGYPIIGIEGYAFATNNNIQEVILNNRIESIGAGAFSQCGNLERIVIPDSVTTISDSAFQNSSNVVIYASSDSYAIAYAKTHGISCVCTDAESYVLGDADGNGSVEIIDVTVIQRTLADIPVADRDTAERNGDVDADGLNVIDATWIQRYLASMNTPYAIGQTITVNS